MIFSPLIKGKCYKIVVKVVVKWLLGGRPSVLLIFLKCYVYLFLPTELCGSVPVLITRRHGAMFLRRKEGYFLFSIVLQNGFYNIT